MIIDRVLHQILKEELKEYEIYYLEPSELDKEKFLLLYPVSTIARREAGALWMHFRLDVFHKNFFDLRKITEEIIDIINHKSFKKNGWIIELLRANENMFLKLEDDSYKIPIDIRFMCKKEN